MPYGKQYFVYVIMLRNIENYGLKSWHLNKQYYPVKKKKKNGLKMSTFMIQRKEKCVFYVEYLYKFEYNCLNTQKRKKKRDKISQK